MLRIEKKSRTKSVYVSIREKGKMFTPSFIRALVIAVSLHASGFLFFNIQPYRILQTQTQFPPVQVNIEMAVPDSSIYAELKRENKQQIALNEPSWAEPLIPLQSLSSKGRFLALPKTDYFPDYPFVKSREKVFFPDWIALSPPSPVIRSTPAINITGPLSDRLILSNLFQKAVDLPSRKIRAVSARYLVKVDDQTGKIFWFHLEGAEMKEKTARKFESILTDLQFEPLSSSFLSHGEIEICLALSKKEEEA